MKNKVKPTEAELDILQILWQQGASSVRTVNELLNEISGDKAIGYTTTLKQMQIMLDKKLVSRDASQRTHIYKAAVAENKMQNSLLDNFVDKTFRGSAMKMVMQALGNHDASAAELEEIKSLIAKIEKENKAKD